MRDHRMLFCLCAAVLVAAVLASCSPAAAAPTQAPAAVAPAEPAAPAPKPAVTVIYQGEQDAVQATAAPAVEAPAAAAADQAGGGANAMPDPALLPKPNRLIIKNGEMSLEVEDTDAALDRVTQMAADLGGYVVSSETSYKEAEGQRYKYASLTVGVPSAEFETALRRLRQIARRVLNESASGQDVTDEYVDQESRLKNLQATRDRIRGFLDQAKTVEEALQVSDQLKQVEDEIEQVQGRMNYLFDRAAYSTIAISLNPYIPPTTPTVTPTPTITPTPTATPTATPWKPGETYQRATKTLGSLYRGLVETLIYGGVVCVPFLIPLALVLWAALWLRGKIVRRRKAGARPAAPIPAEPGSEANPKSE